MQIMCTAQSKRQRPKHRTAREKPNFLRCLSSFLSQFPSREE
ncbi:hypothetical protein PITC_005150 [Penicillium italicum]|uniref:Uncharacterized protein n=1 Tax=Penicillium italicum TaxID=40296 RepID=A0A0A2LCD4_PENIT|nr:hypothetical protein PITC_005150 [Penicillium italicum]